MHTITDITVERYDIDCKTMLRITQGGEIIGETDDWIAAAAQTTTGCELYVIDFAGYIIDHYTDNDARRWEALWGD